jgi:hypothetical protein
VVEYRHKTEQGAAMRFTIATAILLASVMAASAQSRGLYGNSNSFGGSGGFGTGSNSNSHSSSGYTTNKGTYVQPYHATNPNSTQYDNYSTRGNVNPYTGAYGTRSPRY